jgi:hypothetical protein
MSATISPAVRTRIDKILKMLDSPNEYESKNAHFKLKEVLAANNLTMRDVIGRDPAEQTTSRPNPQSESGSRYGGDRPWHQVAQTCLTNATRYSGKEQKFLHDMAAWRSQPSFKQLDGPSALHER